MKGIIGFKGHTPQYGMFENSHDVVVVSLLDSGENVPAKNLECIKDHVFYSNLIGYYIPIHQCDERQMLEHKMIKGQHLYNYSFEREYEAVNHLDLFSGNEKLLDPARILGANDIKYTFGLEYETACGMIPEHLCFRDGLIPLRDGSITGVEYSTIVLKKEVGVNLIRQQLNTLKEYTEFNKECALHMHLGGFPVRGSFVFSLYSLFFLLQEDIKRYCNEFVYSTAQYKNSRKDYCKKLPGYESFREMYENMVGIKWANSMRKPHPSDIDRNHKWNINTRYYSVNFINMLCYESPKTVEFRFLRPTFNFTKIYTWLLIFNAMLKIAEEFTAKYGSLSPVAMSKACVKEFKVTGSPTLIDVVDYAYSDDLKDAVLKCLKDIRLASKQQRMIGDYIGNETKYEDRILDPNIYLL